MVGMHRHYRSGIGSVLLRLPDMRREARELAAAASAVLDEFGLSGDAESDAADLPFGKLRFLEIARAVAMRPRILLLDEPAAGFNPDETERLGARSSGQVALDVGILLVDHDVPFVFGLCDRVTVMNFGSVIAAGHAGRSVSRSVRSGKPISAQDDGGTPHDPHSRHRPRDRLRIRPRGGRLLAGIRTTGVVNFSEGNYVMIGGFSTYWFLTYTSLPYPLADSCRNSGRDPVRHHAVDVRRAAALAPAKPALRGAARYHRVRRHHGHRGASAARSMPQTLPPWIPGFSLDIGDSRIDGQYLVVVVHDPHPDGAGRRDLAVHDLGARHARLRGEPRHERAARHIARAHGFHIVRGDRRHRRVRGRDDHPRPVHLLGCRPRPMGCSASSPRCSEASARCRARSSAASCSAS